jgi:hypothetical protein
MNCNTSLPNIMSIYQVVQKLLLGTYRQTGYLISHPFWKVGYKGMRAADQEPLLFQDKGTST